MNLLKAGFYTGVSTAARVLAGLVIVKCIAVYVGPSGLGKMGQFISLMTFLTVFAGGGISSGIIKYVAEYRNDPARLHQLLGCGVTFTLITSSIMGMLTLLFSHPLSVWLFDSPDYASLLWVLAFAQIFIAANNFFVAMVNGFKDVARLMWLNVTGTALGLLMMVSLIVHEGLYGALLALILVQAILVFITLPFVVKSQWFRWQSLQPRWVRADASALSQYSLMAFTTALVTPLSQIVVRNYLAQTFSWTEVGYWQGVTKISDVYLLFITMALTAYYLPRLSEINDKTLLKQEIISAYKLVVPATILLALGIYLFKDLLIYLLFSQDFLAMQSLFAMQLLGDVLKISAWLLSFMMLAKAMTKTFLLTEVLFGASFVILVWLLTPSLGVTGVTTAFAINALLYLLVMWWVFKRYINSE